MKITPFVKIERPNYLIAGQNPRFTRCRAQIRLPTTASCCNIALNRARLGVHLGNVGWSVRKRLKAPERENPVAQCRPTRQSCPQSAFSWRPSGKCRFNQSITKQFALSAELLYPSCRVRDFDWGNKMRKFVLLAAPLALAACAHEAEVEEVAATEAVEVAAVTTANGTATPMTGEVSSAEGPQGQSTLNADGTYQDLDAEGALVAEGTWAVVEGKTCFTPTTEGAEGECWTESEPAEDGSFTATSDGGTEVTVTPVAAE